MPELHDYLAEARRLERQGDPVEALWCYETILHTPFIDREPALFDAASTGMAQLLVHQARHAASTARQVRFLDLAIAVLAKSVASAAGAPVTALLLAEAYGLRYTLLGRREDLLSANLQLDTITRPATPMLMPELQDRAMSLRARLSDSRHDHGL